MQGLKYDKDKPRWDLLPLNEVEHIVKVLTCGAKKYEDWNWQKVISKPGGKDRYFAAMLRHIAAYQRGEIIDPETKLPHLAHAGCCLLFILWQDRSV